MNTIPIQCISEVVSYPTAILDTYGCPEVGCVVLKQQVTI